MDNNENLIYTLNQRGYYSIADINNTLTVGELIEILEQYDKSIPIYLSLNNGWNYGGLFENNFYLEDNEGNEIF